MSHERVLRRSRSGEAGLTLIEVLVSIIILSIIAGAIAAIFQIGLKVVAPNGPQARLLAAHDLTILEQDLGQDGARAACIKVGGTAYGSCSHGFAAVTCGSGSLCFGWPQLSDGSCHVAVYASGTGISATRTEYSVSGGVPAQINSVPLAREQHVDVSVGAVVTMIPPGQTYTWVRSVTVTVTGSGIANGPSRTLSLQPVATDPAGPTSAINGLTPC